MLNDPDNFVSLNTDGLCKQLGCVLDGIERRSKVGYRNTLKRPLVVDRGEGRGEGEERSEGRKWERGVDRNRRRSEGRGCKIFYTYGHSIDNNGNYKHLSRLCGS